MKNKEVFTKEMERELKKRSDTMPTFPETTPLGDPITRAYWFTGEELRRMVKAGTWRGPKIGDLKKIKDKQRVGPLIGFKDRIPYDILKIAWLKEGGEGVKNAYLKYMKDYEIYLKRKLDNTKTLKDKNTNNEKNETAPNNDGNVGRIIGMDEYIKFPNRSNTNSTEGHGSNLKPESE